MPVDVDGFLRKFTAFGARPTVEGYVALFHPEGTTFDAGLEAPIGLATIPEHIETILSILPDFQFHVRRWRAREATVFVEARNSGTVAGKPLVWDSVYCMLLDGDLTARARRYYDRHPLYATVDPSLPRMPTYEPAAGAETAPRPPTLAPFADAAALVDAYTARWEQPDPDGFARFYAPGGTLRHPGLARPLSVEEIPAHYRYVRSLVPDLRMERLCWAGDDEAVFIEWRATGSVAGIATTFDLADRFLLAGGLIREARSYYDSLRVVAVLESVA